jgi:hypothetical protein
MEPHMKKYAGYYRLLRPWRDFFAFAKPQANCGKSELMMRMQNNIYYFQVSLLRPSYPFSLDELFCLCLDPACLLHSNITDLFNIIFYPLAYLGKKRKKFIIRSKVIFLTKNEQPGWNPELPFIGMTPSKSQRYVLLVTLSILSILLLAGSVITSAVGKKEKAT